MSYVLSAMSWQVHCRTGSLEINLIRFFNLNIVHCRTGSLEIGGECWADKELVHCRTGSLEKRSILQKM